MGRLRGIGQVGLVPQSLGLHEVDWQAKAVVEWLNRSYWGWNLLAFVGFDPTEAVSIAFVIADQNTASIEAVTTKAFGGCMVHRHHQSIMSDDIASTMRVVITGAALVVNTVAELETARGAAIG